MMAFTRTGISFTPTWFRVSVTHTFAVVERLRAQADKTGRSMTGLALSWPAAQPTVPSVLVGATSAEQITANAAALEELPAELIADISEAAGEHQA